jgi:predicted transglutaminase-like cysteine proteinase
MPGKSKAVLGTALAATMIVALGAAKAESGERVERVAYASIGSQVRPPIGWVEFCNENPKECTVASTEPRDVVLTSTVWKDLVRVNRWVNESIQPVTDMDHWGVVERWSYPDDGKGDCEDYVLLKRRMLMQAGWPREALLITVVRDKKGDGHAVLTVKTDKGEFILDNQAEEVLLWSETGYRFVKRQAQSNPNLWIALGDPRPPTSTASPRAEAEIFLPEVQVTLRIPQIQVTFVR